jgi:hypothetical protein
VVAAVAGLLLHAVLRSPTQQPDIAKPDRPRPAREPDEERTKWGEVLIPGLEDYLGQHPFETVAAVLGAGLMLRAALRSRSQRPEIAKPDESQRRALRESLPERPLPAQPKSPAARPRTHHFGAADMEFTTHHPNGRNVEFRFAWKKRPVDAPEADWPTDEMGFTAVRPNGKHTAFTFKGKTRPIPDEKTAVGDSRPGLGWAKMEFKKSAPGRRDFKFRWSRVPPSAAPTASTPPAGKKPPGKPKPR